MRRLSVALGVLGLILTAALPARAAEVTLFGKKYNVVMESRGQTYKNGLKVTLPSEGNKKANLHFVPGADASQDRLFVAATIQGTDGVVGDQLYVLTGADANGLFSKDSASLTQFFGGAEDHLRGGRPTAVLWLSDANTGTKVDRNLAVFNFGGADHFRFFDFDTMGTFDTDMILAIPQPEEGGEDPGMPNGDMAVLAPGPNGTLLMAGRAAADDEGIRNHIEIGVMDPKQDKFFDVKTDLMSVTQDSTVKIDPIDPNTEPNAFAHAGGAEYWMIVSGDQQGDNDNAQGQFLYRMTLTFPANLASAAPGSIKASILAREDLTQAKALFTSDGGVFGMAVGREVAPGLRRLYFADWQGNLYTATPAP
jgi:hypothetical protein